MNLPINLSELETIITTLLSEGKCACHIINPHKTRILMWQKIIEGQTIYHLRIGIQKFTSQEQQDRNGEVYWRYYSFENKEPTNLDSITKTEPIKPDKSHEPAVNQQSN